MIFLLFCLFPKIDNIPERIPRRCVQAYIVRKCFISSFQVNNKLMELFVYLNILKNNVTFLSINFCWSSGVLFYLVLCLGVFFLFIWGVFVWFFVGCCWLVGLLSA